ncbi:outer membrane protein assembly factor BamC [Thiopseudomonas denitrificans]|uniref:Beta-barrel assembly machine subunit BamC n=1 Tax=Thiopseudomonas denitrificans TaxID=1501432 RepID=A0A4R6TXG2_9GAMM|nr:outer membrane protein assembly factor BamC [Thiopseudomonas denitrificans]TDQ38570.1 Beta-barrel assembly machine subunit BamC [Thiopseudomonas denitrificans]
MKRIAGAALVLAGLTSLSGCSWLWGDKGYFRDRGNDYLDARMLPPMQVPEGTESKPLDPLLPVPGHVADISGNREAVVQRPHAVNQAMLEGDFSIQRSSEQSWILAQRIPAQMWNMTQAYFEELGYTVDEERPHVGEFTTAWLPAASIAEGTRETLGLGKSHDSRFRVRIEPGVQRNTSEIFVDAASRKGSRESGWSAGKSAPEAGLALAGLERFYNQAGSQGQSYSLLASKNYDAPRRVALIEAGEGGLQVLRLDAGLEQAWSGVGRALSAAGIYVDDVDRSQAVYFVDLGRKAEQKAPGFFKRMFSSKKSLERKASDQQYRVKLTQISRQVFVGVEREPGQLADVATTNRILNAIRPHLN